MLLEPSVYVGAIMTKLSAQSMELKCVEISDLSLCHRNQWHIKIAKLAGFINFILGFLSANTWVTVLEGNILLFKTSLTNCKSCSLLALSEFLPLNSIQKP